ncbi:unnamed protein product [Allacma fusca]|uniref:Uncharacterized protein n=1 Tax=Allacma fusca TaxID=39272 RepID=A0A8J2NY00_9HEXA|nr:unnamed protein product [Allacma fusca]
MSCKFLLCVALIATSISPGKSAFPCKLEWLSVMANSAIQEDWVRIDSQKEGNPLSGYIARLESLINVDDLDTNSDKDFILASVQPSMHKATGRQVAGVISEDNIYGEFSLMELVNSETLYTYEVLTNPHNCKLSWESCTFEEDTLSMTSRRYARVSASNVTRNNYIARVETNEGGKRYSIVGLGPSDKEFYSGSKMACLLATATAQVNVTQFEFNYSNVASDQEDMIGFDEINNEAETSVVQTVTHTKIFTEKHSFKQRHSWHYISYRYYRPYFWCIWWYSWARLYPIHHAYSSSEDTLLFQSNKTIISSRVMNVPPQSSIQACSTVTFNDKYELAYTAEGRYIPDPGVSMADVETTIKEAGYTSYRNEGDSFVVDMEGTFEGKMAFRSSFFVTSTDGEITCKNWKQKFERRNVLKNRVAFNPSDENIASLRKVELEIQDIKRILTTRRQIGAKP